MTALARTSSFRGPLSHFGVLALSLLIVLLSVQIFPQEVEASQVYKVDEKTEVEVEDNKVHLHKERTIKTPDEVKKESEDIYELLKKTKPEDLEKLIQAAEGMLEDKPKKKKKKKEKTAGDLGSMISEFLPLAVNALGNEDIIGMAANMLGGGDENNLTGMLNLAQSIFSQPKTGKQANPMSSLLQLAALFTPDNQGGENINFMEVVQTASNFISQSGVLGGGKRGEDGGTYSIFVDLIAQYAGIDRDTVKHIQDVILELVSARDWNSFNSALKRKTGVSLDETLDLLENGDIKTEVMKTYTPQLVDHIYDFFHPANFQTNLKYLSAIAVSKGYEALDPKRPKKSLAKLIDRVVKENLNLKADSIVYLDRIEANIRNMLRIEPDEEINLSKFDKALLTERFSEVQREELLDPIIEAFKLYKKAAANPECLEVLLCFVNHPNNVATTVGFKGTMTRLTSSIVAWFLSSPEKGRKFADLYQAILDGDSGLNCEARYKGSCPEEVIGSNPFLMKLNYHTEL